MKHRFLPLLAVLPLLACTPARDKADTGEAIAEGAGLGDGPTGRVGRPVAKGAEKGPIPNNIDEGIEPAPVVDNGAIESTAAAVIPALFRGRWALTEADCKGDAAAKGLLTIEESSLLFYESRGVLDRIASNSPSTRLTADFRFTGEGQQWSRAVTLQRDGSRLRRMESGGEEGPVDLTYTACPSR